MSKEDDIIDNLILSGALEISGIDDKTSEFLFTMTPKMQEVMPELYQEHLNDVNKYIMVLWEKGFVDINFNEDNPIVRLNPISNDSDEVSRLDRDHQWALAEIQRLIIG
jgi:hypothetical protein